jgi:hypothetical protein
MTEQGYELPFEITWLGTQDALVPVFEKVQAYSFADTRVSHDSLAVSLSAEMRDGQPVLAVSSQQKLICYRNTENAQKVDAAEMWKCVSGRNQQIIRAMRSLLKITTFTPQVGKKIEGGEIGKGKTWLTSLRLDGENRLRVTGYAFEPKQVTGFGKELFKSGAFVEVSLLCMTKNVYERTPVWRFDFVAKTN